MVFARVGAPLRIEDRIQREGGVPLHDVGKFEARGEQGVGEGPPALWAISGTVMLLSAPVLCDTLATEIVLAAETYRVLVNTQAD